MFPKERMKTILWGLWEKILDEAKVLCPVYEYVFKESIFLHLTWEKYPNWACMVLCMYGYLWFGKRGGWRLIAPGSRTCKLPPPCQRYCMYKNCRLYFIVISNIPYDYLRRKWKRRQLR